MLYSSVPLSFQHTQLPLILVDGLVEADHAHKFLVKVCDLHRFLIFFFVTAPLGVIVLYVDFIFGIILVKLLFKL
jgi:hypothetical protein